MGGNTALIFSPDTTKAWCLTLSIARTARRAANLLKEGIIAKSDVPHFRETFSPRVLSNFGLDWELHPTDFNTRWPFLCGGMARRSGLCRNPGRVQ